MISGYQTFNLGRHKHQYRSLLTATFTPSSNSVTVWVGTTNPPLKWYWKKLCKYKKIKVEESYLVKICDKVGDKYRFGFNGQEKVNEIMGVGNFQDYGFRNYYVRISKFISADPLSDHPRQIGMSPYSAFWNNPIKYTDPDGRCPDCPNGEYQIQKGDNFWALEKKWNMPQGSLQGMNKGIDPTKLQIGQTINTTLSQSDLPEGVMLHSSNSMNGMDGFFKKGTEGVNKIINITEIGYDNFAKALANVSEGGISENTTGGAMDAKKYFLTNKDQYSTNTKTWFKEQTSVSEPNTRALFVYKGIGYNINEFGNLTFGSAKAINGVSLRILITGGHIYSIFSNGKMDDPNEVKAVKRGYGYYKK